MLPSMFSGISGLKANQKKLDVIGNNIANVGTTGFKVQKVKFQDMLSQNVGEATGPGQNTGGTNPRQVGLGVQLGGIDTITSTGNMQPTGRSLDAAIDGNGYFMVGKGAVPATNANGVTLDTTSHVVQNSNGMSIMFTRDGSFALDEAGNLLTSDGNRVLGYALSTGGSNSIDYKAGKAEINFVAADNANIKAGNVLIPLVIPDIVSVPAMDIAAKPAVSQAIAVGKSADTLMIDAGSNNEKANGVNFKFEASADPLADLSVTFDDATKTINVILSQTPANNTAANLETKIKALTSTVEPFTGTFFNNFNVTGQGVWSGTGLDTSVAGNFANATINLAGGTPATTTTAQESRIKSFSIEKGGLIKAVLDNGSVTALGQIAISTFKNDGGLSKLGKNLYQNSANSGTPIVRSGIGDTLDNASGYGDILQSMLEMSNVDLAEQFTDMIVASRAFQANGKMITTGDEILQDLVNLKR